MPAKGVGPLNLLPAVRTHDGWRIAISSYTAASPGIIRPERRCSLLRFAAYPSAARLRSRRRLGSRLTDQSPWTIPADPAAPGCREEPRTPTPTPQWPYRSAGAGLQSFRRSDRTARQPAPERCSRARPTVTRLSRYVVPPADLQPATRPQTKINIASGGPNIAKIANRLMTEAPFRNPIGRAWPGFRSTGRTLTRTASQLTSEA
jgi:hypothetical protein